MDDDLQKTAEDAARKLIAASGQAALIREIALWLTFERDELPGEDEDRATHRLELEAQKRWPESTSTDFYTAISLSGRALELRNDVIEAGLADTPLH